LLEKGIDLKAVSEMLGHFRANLRRPRLVAFATAPTELLVCARRDDRI
jgi:hypothetical protein